MQDKRVGKGKLMFTEQQSTLMSQFIDDQADGHGIYEDKYGNSFQSAVAEERGSDTGAIRNGKLFNMGKIKFKNDDKYKGIFKDGRPSQLGEMTYSMSLEGVNGQNESGMFKGEFKCGKRHGHGIMRWEDGSVFDGIWNADERVSGQMQMTNGTVMFTHLSLQFYFGPFKNDRMDGQAKLVLQIGLIFEIEFKQGVCPSIGKLLYPNGNMYYGQHKEFRKEGLGKMAYFNGDVYEG